QLIASGDFLQLPPVITTGQPLFAFQSKSWSSVIKSQFLLKTVYRQTDQDFIRALNWCRVTDLDDETVKLFSSLSRPIFKDFVPQCQPVYLFSTQQEIDQFNKARLSSIQPPVLVFQLCNWVRVKRDQHLLGSMLVNSAIKLKI
ncbi:hypothetical protein J3R83DRAFT_7645, partial [Lanmaoa asiatica]